MDISALSFPVLAAIFIAAALAIWYSGIKITDTTNKLSKHFGLGQALGGLILLAIVTNLPELVIVSTAAIKNNVGLAVGNILGGIAMQTVVLVLLDVFGLGKKGALTYKAASIELVLEAVTVLAVLSIVVMGHQLPANIIIFHITPAGLLIFVVWIAGVKLVSKAKTNVPWKLKEPETKDNQSESESTAEENKQSGIKKTIIIFLISSAVTLVAGVALELSSDAIAKDLGMKGVLFGATILAAATSLPEVSTGLASIKMKAYDLAISDIFGGNSFLPVLFLLATLLSGKAILPLAQKSDIYLTGLAMLLTTIYIYGLLFRPQKQFLRMGIDSLLVLITYFLGVAGLFLISQS